MTRTGSPFLLMSMAGALGLAAGCRTAGVPLAAIQANDRGVKQLAAGMCVEAEESFRYALEYGDWPHPHNGLGSVALICHQDYDQAAEHFKEALALDDDFAEASNNLGTCFMRKVQPDYASACERFQAALEIDPTYVVARENYARCLVRWGHVAGDSEDRTSRYGLAKRHLIRLMQIPPPSGVDPRIQEIAAREMLGFIALERGQFKEAENHLEACLLIDPTHAECSFNLGNVYLQTERCRPALRAYSRALRDGDKGSLEIRQNLRIAYERCAKQDGVIDGLLDQIAKEPGKPESHYDLAMIYKERGLVSEAVTELQATLKLDPGYCVAHYEIAMYGHAVLNTEQTVTSCRDFVECAKSRAHRDRRALRQPERVAHCTDLIKNLEHD